MLGISPQTLRFYEQYGILTHERTGDGNYRQYSDVSMDLLMSLRKCRNCGFTVAQTADILSCEDGEAMAKMLDARAKTLAHQAEMQRRIVERLHATAGLLEQLKARIGCYEEREREAAYTMIVKRAGAQRPEPKAMEQAGMWAEWLPLVRWMTRYQPDDVHAAQRPDMGFVVDADNAAFLGVPELPGIEQIPAQACLYTVMRWRPALGELPIRMREGCEELERRGYRLAGPALAYTLWNAGAREGAVSYGEFWFPIDTDK